MQQCDARSMVQPVSLSFDATPDKGRVSALHLHAQGSRALFVLAHGAGADMSHQHMTKLAELLLEKNISTLRFNFPYMETGGKRTDKPSTCTETIGNAIELARTLEPETSIFLSGHSFGGRMASHYAADLSLTSAASIKGLVYFSFPLHPSKKPDIKRAAHLSQISAPQLFVSGTRDTLAELDLLTPLVDSLKHSSLHLLETADHSFKILKRTRTSTESVYEETGRIVNNWLADIQSRSVTTESRFDRTI